MLEHLGRCVYGGVCDAHGKARADVVAALRELGTPNLRWPGGCYADAYHWRDGIGPVSERRPTVNLHWGNSIESNRFGTAEFAALCKAVGCEMYIVANVGSGSVQEGVEWLEYLNCPGGSSLAELRAAHGCRAAYGVSLWGVGNECWGCGGHMKADEYAAEYRRHATFLRRHEGAPPLCRVACGANADDYGWTECLMARGKAGGRWLMEALSVHLYCSVRPERVLASADDEASWFLLLRKADNFGQMLRGHCAVMDRFDPECAVALAVDEWAVWYAPAPQSGPPKPPARPGPGDDAVGHEEQQAAPAPGAATAAAAGAAGTAYDEAKGCGMLEQQSTLRDALLAALCLHRMSEQAHRVKLANLAQALNVLHCPLRIDRGVLVQTPTFHALKMLRQAHADGLLLHSQLSSQRYSLGEGSVPRFSAFVTQAADAAHLLSVSVVHLHPHSPTSLLLEVRGAGSCDFFAAEVLTSRRLTAVNTRAVPDAVASAPLEASHVERQGQAALKLHVPPQSLVTLLLRVSSPPEPSDPPRSMSSCFALTRLADTRSNMRCHPGQRSGVPPSDNPVCCNDKRTW